MIAVLVHLVLLALALGRRIWSYDPNPLRAPCADLPPATAREIRRDRHVRRLQLPGAR